MVEVTENGIQCSCKLLNNLVWKIQYHTTGITWPQKVMTTDQGMTNDYMNAWQTQTDVETDNNETSSKYRNTCISR